jgi:hypothetical protein
MRVLAFILVFMTAASGRAEMLHARTFDPVNAQAFKGTIEFTPAEVSAHLAGLTQLIDVTLRDTEAKKVEQADWFRKCKMGTMYGWLAPYSTLAAPARQTYIDQHSQCSARPTLADVAVTSCENFTNKFLSRGFAAIGTAASYKKINTFLNANDRDGLALVLALRKLGWKTLYWNTDLGSAPALPKDRSIVGATPDDHLYDQKLALTKHTYHGVPVDGYLTNFSPNTGSPTVKDDSVMAKLREVPYFVGISHAGFHVWNGSYGVITESHSFFDPDDVRNIQTGDFDPPHASPTCREVVVAGQKQSWCYYSGILAVPPGPWIWF